MENEDVDLEREEENIDEDKVSVCNPDIGQDIDVEISKIKGDAIGNTLYSERWVLKVLIQLSQYTEEVWSDRFEQDLCLLWDMTTEHDVVLFLLKNEFYAVFGKVIRSTGVSRLIEILVGIIGNMCCVQEARTELTSNGLLCNLLINILTVDDSLTLIQLVRLFNTCLWKLRKPDQLQSSTRPSSPEVRNERIDTDIEENVHQLGNLLSHMDTGSCNKIDNTSNESSLDVVYETQWIQHLSNNKDMFLQYISFFLSSSTNEELLCCTLELLEILLEIPKLNIIQQVADNTEFVGSLIESLKQLLKSVKVGDSINSNKHMWRASHVWKNIIGHIATVHSGRIHLGLQGNEMMKCLVKLILVFTTPEALKTQDPLIVMECLYVLESLPCVQINSAVIARLIMVLYQIRTVNQNEETEVINRSEEREEERFEMSDFILRIENYCTKILKLNDDLVQVLNLLTENHLEYLYDIVSKDQVLFKKVYNAIIQLRTNGLVQ